MTDNHTTTNGAKNNMGALEALLKGLPGIREYTDNESRRAADRRLREQISMRLDNAQQQLSFAQRESLSRTGLASMGMFDALVRQMQTMSDRIKSTGQGYTGFFSDIRIHANELNALHAYDMKLAESALQIEQIIQSMTAAQNGHSLESALQSLSTAVQKMNQDISQRQAVILELSSSEIDS